jgi:heterotetrameric sarcosine oxidase gamma subunit
MSDNAGVTAMVREEVGLATVMARRGASDALTQRVRERFGIDLPQGPRRSDATGLVFAGTGPGAWLALIERDGDDLAPRLMSELDGVASVSDQSDGYTVIRLSGARVRDALAKLIPVDVHPHAFKVGDVASTVASHIGVTVWRLPDEPKSSAVFEVILFRSLTRSFQTALAEACAEYGFSE